MQLSILLAAQRLPRNMSDSEDATSTSVETEDQSADEEATSEELGAIREERDTLATRVEELEAERDELEGRLKRTAADFENYKKRQAKKHEQLKDAATEDLLERLLDVRDNLKRAIEQASADGESLREGVELTLAEFDRVLDAEDVSEIDPEPGAQVDPQRHEVMMRVAGEQPEGHVEAVYNVGYEMAGNVLRAAQVGVSDGEADDTE